MKKKQSLFPLLIGFIIFVLWVENSSVHAQASTYYSKRQLAWLNAGIGGGSWELALGGNLSYQNGRNLFSFRCIYDKTLLGASGIESAVDLGILYGIIAKAKDGFASVSVGIGILRVDSYEVSSTVGIPIEGQLFFTPSPFLGIGLYPFAHLNLKYKDNIPVGILLCIQIGKLR